MTDPANKNDDHDAPEVDDEELSDPDEEAVRRLQAGPHSAEGKEEVAAAGIDTPH